MLWSIASILLQATLLPEATEEVIEKAGTQLRNDPWRGELISEVFFILRFFLPSRCLLFDAELDTVEDAGNSVWMDAYATCGEWVDAQVHVTELPERADGCWEARDFVCQGTSYHGEFHTVTLTPKSGSTSLCLQWTR